MRRSPLVSGGGAEGQEVQGHLQNFDMSKMWTKSQKNGIRSSHIFSEY